MRILNKLFASKLNRFFSISLILAILIVNVFCFYFYFQAENVVVSRSLDDIPNRSVTGMYFSPLLLQKDEIVSLNLIVEHLNDIAYQEGGDGEGSYLVNKNQLIINSRFPKIFPNATIFFAGDNIRQIAVENQSVDSVLIEPIPMATDIHFIYGEEYPNDPKVADLTTRRVIIKPENIPEMTKHVVTSSEDYKFFVNQGMDWIAIPKRLMTGAGGGSSIHSQIVKNNFFYGANTNAFWNITDNSNFDLVERKIIAEPFLSVALDQNKPKDEIFGAYLNLIPYGASNGVNIQGIVAASQEFFGKSQLSELTLDETASLSAMINSPTNYINYVKNGYQCPEIIEPTTFERWQNRFTKILVTLGLAKKDVSNPKPISKCKNLLVKRNIILDLVHRNYPEIYSEKMIEEAKASPLKIQFTSANKNTRPIDMIAQRFADYSRGKLPTEVSHLTNEEGQIKVITSLNPQLQKSAFEICENTLTQLQTKTDKALQKQKITKRNKYEEIISDCDKRNKKELEKAPPPCDTEKLFKPQIALLAMDAKTGEILAMVGGINSEFNFATMAHRNPASTIKPFLFLKGIESGKMSNGGPLTAATYIDKNIEKNKLNSMCVADDSNLGGSGAIRHQLEMSYNIGACIVNQSAGIPNEFIGKLLGNNPARNLQMSLGVGAETTLINLVQAYSIFPNNGKFVTATAYKNAYQNDKVIDFTRKTSSIQTDPAATFIVTDMMKSVVEDGTAANFKKLAKLPNSVSFAGKTGSGMKSDLLFVGFTPRIILGVWIGIDKNFPELMALDGFTGGKTAVPVAAKFMEAVNKYRPDLLQGEFVQPNNVIKLRVNEKGCLVKNGGREEFFITGREPQSCN